MNFKSIRFRLIFGGCLAIVILLLINGYVSITDSSRALTVLGKKQAGSLAESIAQQIDRIIRSEMKTASAYATDHLLKSVSEKVNTQNKGDIVAEIEDLHQELKEKFKWLGSGYLGIFVTDAEGNL
ncbi:MAG: methyl-accepting chemotaxis protein, partial [Desulfobulbus sp.]